MLWVTSDTETPSRVTTAELSKAANRDKSFLLQVDSIRNFVPVKQRGTVGNSTRELRLAVSAGAINTNGKGGPFGSHGSKQGGH